MSLSLSAVALPQESYDELPASPIQATGEHCPLAAGVTGSNIPHNDTSAPQQYLAYEQINRHTE
jgi:hypothetical protein